MFLVQQAQKYQQLYFMYQFRSLLLISIMPLFTLGQLTISPKIIFKSVNRDTVSIVFTPSTTALLTVKTYNEIIDNNTVISGIHQLDIVLDTSEAVVAYSIGTIYYKIYRNGVDITPISADDNSLNNIKVLLSTCVGISGSNLTASQVRAILFYIGYKNGIFDETGVVKKLKYWAK